MSKLTNGLRYGIETLENTGRKFLKNEKIRCIRYTTTWECNSKCDSCFIWKEDPKKSEIMTLSDLDHFSKSNLLNEVRRIIISGGEPFLLEDLPERMQILHRNCPNAYFGMTANGLTPARTFKLLKKIIGLSPDIDIRNIGLSLNGREDIHDKSRGIKGAFNKTMETFNLIKKIVPVRFSFVFLPYNINEYGWVQEYAKSLGTESYICWTVISNRFYDRNFLNNIPIKKFNNMIRPILNKRVNSMTKKYLYNSFIKERFLDCTACRDFFHIDPHGNIYPCNFKLTPDRRLGNIKSSDFCDIWNNPYKNIIINEIKLGRCLYPNGICGDSDINYSITNSGMHYVLWWHFLNGGKI